jgi:type I restriction enzyme M protein
MAIKKSQLYSRLWKSCDELRGSMGPTQYKDYALTLLFVKYISDKDTLLEVPDGASFNDMVALKGDKEIGDKINKIIAKLAEENDLKDVIDQADFNDDNLLGRGKEMQDRLTRLVAIFETFDFKSNMAGGDDLLGDAYEYLMRNFATESGKSKGQFYTPAEVSRILAKVVGINEHTTLDMTVYDPTCGSGSLLLKAAEEAPNGITVYGQENDQSTYALSRMNMILHQFPTADIRLGNTLSSPHFKESDGSLKRFDFAVANPPFSVKSWTNGLDPDNDLYSRFECGTPPPKNGDYAFLLHVLKSLKSRGKAAVILPHGVLFRGNREAVIRKCLVDQGYIRAIIGLPANLFYGTGIPACVIVLDKENANQRESIYFINARKGFVKDGNKNRLREQDVHKIVDYFKNEVQEEGYSRTVPVAEICSEANDYNLNIPRYIDSTEPEDLHDLGAHLNGGIPNTDIDALGTYWDVFGSLRSSLFSPLREGYSASRVEPSELQNTIGEHLEVRGYKHNVQSTFNGWKQAHESMLKSLDASVNAKQLIVHLAEDLLNRFHADPLLDKYDVYQCIVEYWFEKMQDDVFMIAEEGWNVCKEIRPVEQGEEAQFTLKIGKKGVKHTGSVLPASLILSTYLASEESEVNQLQSAYEQLVQEREDLEEEHGGEEGVFSSMEKVNKKVVTAEKKKLEEDEDSEGELAVLRSWLDLNTRETAAKKTAKTAHEGLMVKLAAQYGNLTEQACKDLLVNGKWYASMESAIGDETNRLVQHLSGRLKAIGERYASTLGELEAEVEAYGKKVEEHLKKMGIEW